MRVFQYDINNKIDYISTSGGVFLTILEGKKLPVITALEKSMAKNEKSHSNNMNHLRRTKIVVTLGPSIDDPIMLEKVILAGAVVFRANFSHGEISMHKEKKITLKEDQDFILDTALDENEGEEHQVSLGYKNILI